MLAGSSRLAFSAARLEKSRSSFRHWMRADRLEAMRLQRLDQRIGKRIDARRDAERAVAHVAAGAAGDLAELGGGQLAILVAVIFAVGGEGDVVEVEVEAHADRVGRDEEVDVAVLIDLDLLVARARAERAEHDRRAAALAADQLADRVDLVGREGDDRRALRQPRELLLAGIGEHRHARPRDDVHARQELLDDAAHGGGAEQQRLLAAAKIEDAVGKDVAALEVAGELHLVDRDERGVGLARHRLDGRDPVARIGRQDLFLAGDERDLVRADARGDAAIDLARQKPERQADDAALVAEHALDREVGLAGIRRPKHGCHVPGAKAPRAGGSSHDVIGNSSSDARAIWEMGLLTTPCQPNCEKSFAAADSFPRQSVNRRVGFIGGTWPEQRRPESATPAD